MRAADLITRDTVILFGAGASKGATHVTPADPPLGQALYSELASRFPNEWGSSSVLGKFAKELTRDFETTMLMKIFGFQPTSSLLAAHRSMALYFASFAPDGSAEDYYSKLLAALRAHDRLNNVTFASLNYDCLLEIAALSLGVGVDYVLDDPPPGWIPELS